jgi:hypothetical protein
MRTWRVVRTRDSLGGTDVSRRVRLRPPFPLPADPLRYASRPQPMSPLTHHEILALVAPFARRGRHVDLAASDRAERRIAFKPIDHPGDADGDGRPPLHETLVLENGASGWFTLTRELATPSGLRAVLVAEGNDPGALLTQIEAVPAARQFVLAPQYELALGHRVEASAKPAEGEGTTRLRLVAAEGRLDGVALRLKVSRVPGVPGELALVPAAGDRLDVPEDLLAVLGWPWSRLTRTGDGWQGLMRLRGHEPERTRDAETKLEATAVHLARTLAEPPARFHERMRTARWRVTMRRAVPLLVCLALVPASLLVPQLTLDDNSVFRMLLFHAPPLLLLLFVALPEMPRIEIPPLPRRLTAPTWRKAPQADTGA